MCPIIFETHIFCLGPIPKASPLKSIHGVPTGPLDAVAMIIACRKGLPGTTSWILMILLCEGLPGIYHGKSHRLWLQPPRTCVKCQVPCCMLTCKACREKLQSRCWYPRSSLSTGGKEPWRCWGLCPKLSSGGRQWTGDMCWSCILTCLLCWEVNLSLHAGVTSSLLLFSYVGMELQGARVGFDKFNSFPSGHMAGQARQGRASPWCTRLAQPCSVLWHIKGMDPGHKGLVPIWCLLWHCQP